MTAIQPFSPALWPTPLFGAPGQVLLDPNHEFNAPSLQDGLRASWWAPALNDSEAATGLSDVADAIEAPYVAPSPQFDMDPVGTPVVRITDAKWDRCVQLNGSTDYFNVADHADLRVIEGQSLTFTAWAWIQAPLANALSPIFSKGTLGTGEIVCFVGTDPTVYFAITRANGNRYITGIGGVPLQQWVMITCFWDHLTERVGIAVNGSAPVESGQVTVDASPEFTGDFEIGAWSSANVFFAGKIDEVTRWDRRLTPNEIEWLLQNDLWNGAIALFKAASGNPLEYPYQEAVADPDLPAAPSALYVTPDGSNEVDLAWCINAIGPGNWHEIERSVDGGAFSKIGNASPGENTFHDADADTSAHGYGYRVRARNKFGASEYSETVHSDGFADPEGGHFADPETGGNFQDPEA